MYLVRHHALDAHHAPDAQSADPVVRELADRVEVLDALYRFALGRDVRDRALFESAFAPEAEFDFRPAAVKFGLELPLMTGRQMIADIVLNPEVRIDTTHVVSNPRISVDGDSATLTALVEAQHLPTGDHSRHALLKNLYAVELVRDGARWVITRMHIDNVWFTGDPKVIIGL